MWTNKYLTGDDKVDGDHRKIFELVESILDLSAKDLSTQRDTKIKTVVDFLSEYIKTHFASEDRLMREMNYPDIEQHRKEHADLTSKVYKLREDFHTHGSTLDLSLFINKFLIGWITTHIMDSDKKMINYYNNKK